MSLRFLTTALCAAFLTCGLDPAHADGTPPSAPACPAILEFQATRLRSDAPLDFCAAYAGRPLLVVNTASRCGYTPQFADLEALYQRYRDRGFAIVGFPSNDFRQEYEDAAATARVCYVNYGVTFDMVEESSVRGASANPLFRRLADATGAPPRWNFNKYLIDTDGSVRHFGSATQPLGGALESAVREALQR